jgi:hypothetical protein
MHGNLHSLNGRAGELDMPTPSRIPSVRRGLVAAGAFATVAISVAVGCLGVDDEKTVNFKGYPAWAAAVNAGDTNFATPDGGGPDVFVHRQLVGTT